MCKCCPCALFDTCCIKRLASIPEFVQEDDMTFVFAWNAMHANDIKTLVGKDCYNALCLRANQLRDAVDWQFAGTYALGDTVLQAGICYVSLINSNIGNAPAVNPLLWEVSGPTLADTNLIEAMQQYAAYRLEWYYRNKRNAGDIEPAGVHIKMPENAQMPMANAMANTLKMLDNLSETERLGVVEFLEANALIYPCYVPIKTCSDTNTTGTWLGGFLNIKNLNK